MKKMLILSGPQGAGNHLWSKVFSLHPEVYGWKSLLDNYWEAHRFSEPFAKHWKDTSLLRDFDWSQSDYYFTSISCPLGIYNSETNPIYVPNLMDFANVVRECGITIEFAIVGRDQTILSYQQNRIRNKFTLPILLDQLHNIDSPTFLSYELLYLYKQDYLKSLNLNIPIAYDDVRLNKILEDDANEKYIHNVEYVELDKGNKFGITFANKP
jgi:hypothetical protein